MAICNISQARMLPGTLSLRSGSVLLDALAGPGAVDKNQAIGEVERGRGRQRVVFIEHEGATDTGVGIIAHKPFVWIPRIASFKIEM